MEIKIKIKDNTFIVPDEVTARQWSVISILPRDPRHLISNVLGCSPFDIQQLDEEDILEMYEYCVLPLKGLYKDGGSKITDEQLEGLTFGQWIDLDVLAHREPNLYLCEILEMLGLEGVEDRPLSEVIGSFKHYLTWRASVYKNYKNLFGLEDASSEDTDPSEVDIERVWYDAIMLLADDNFSNIDLVTEKPYKAALNYMAWKKEKTMRELEEMKKIQKK